MHVFNEMGHKTITISEEAYQILASLKKEKESFTHVIKRVLGDRSPRPLSGFAGRWEGSPQELEEIFGEMDREWERYAKKVVGG
jgi:predicted CopG family antitoxin